MLASSLREEGQMTVSNKPGHRGEHEVSRKTIARGMPVRSGVTVVTTLGCLFLSAPRLRRIKRPAFPAPSDFREREIVANLGRMARRDRGLIFAFDVIARSKATKQSTLTSRQHGLLRGARYRARIPGFVVTARLRSSKPLAQELRALQPISP